MVEKWETEYQYYDKATSTNFQRLFLRGPKKEGKTTFVGTVPGIFVIDCDQGGRVLKDKAIPFVSVSLADPNPYSKVRRWIDSFVSRKGPFTEGAELAAITALGLDAASSLSEILLIHFSRQLGMDLSSLDTRKNIFSQYNPAWQPLLFAQTELFHMLMSVADRHVVVTSHIQEKTDEQGRTIGGEAQIFGGFRDRIDKIFNEVLFIYRRGKKYILSTEDVHYDNVLYPCRVRTHGLPAEVEDPTFEKLYAKPLA